MVISRRSFITGLIAAPLIVRAGIIMPIKPIDPRPDIARAFAADIGTMVVHGKDRFDYDIVETIRPGHAGQKIFKYVTSIEYVGGPKFKPHPFAGVPGSYTGINMSDVRGKP